MQFNVNTNNIVKFSNLLDRIGKSALPKAVMGTLNDAVFDVKTVTMPSFASEFINRKETFFKANSKFEKASGNNINTMKSTVGFFENKLANQNTNYAVKDLEEQENGGAIGGKAFIPLDTARVGKSFSKNVKPNARLYKLKESRFINARNQKGKSKSEKFINAFFKAGVGGYILGSETKGENIVWRVNSISTNIKTKKLDITPLYDYKKGRSVMVKPTHFMKKASERTAKSLDAFFMKRATAQLNKMKL